MLRRLTLHLHLALAKSLADYLSEAGDDKDKALEALRRDLVQREGQNSKARAFQRAYSKLVERLKLPTDPEDADAASDAALDAIRAMSEAGATQAQISKVLEKLGLDPAKLEEQVTHLKSQAEQGAEGLKLKRELAYRDAADALGYDAAKLVKVLRDEPGLPEKRAVKSKNEKGEDVTSDVWGIPTRDAGGKEIGFTALQEHGEVKGFEAALKKADTNPASVPHSGPSLPHQRPTAAPTGPVKLDPASVQANFAANGAGSI